MGELEPLLFEWGAWVDAGGRIAGYPATSPLHPNWTPPAPGPSWRMPMPRGDARLRQVHAAVAELPVKLREVLVMVYVLKLPSAERAERAGCAVAGFNGRLQRARVALAVAVAG